jgi:small subunit ribosomal protein S20
MPITSSAKKALRASKRKRVFNVRRKKDIDTALLAFRKAIVAKDKAAAAKLMPEISQSLDKAAKTGFIKANAAARLKSRAAASLAKLA